MGPRSAVMARIANSGLTSHQQRSHTETGSWFKVSSERLEKQEIDFAIPGLVVYITPAPIKASAIHIMSI